jgi:hypothetical protein
MFDFLWVVYRNRFLVSPLDTFSIHNPEMFSIVCFYGVLPVVATLSQWMTFLKLAFFFFVYLYVRT